MAFSVIRLGFEPKTHSLEGCCSIQLSYRTDPYLLLTCSGTDVKSGCKDSDYFWICNKMFWFGLFFIFRVLVLFGFESIEMTLLVLWRAGMMVESTEMLLFVLSRGGGYISALTFLRLVGRPSFHCRCDSVHHPFWSP